MKSKTIKLLIGYGVSILLLTLVAQKIEWGLFLTAIKSISTVELCALVGLYLFGFLLRGIRTSLMVPKLTFTTSLGSVFIGYAANNIYPARLGEVLRAQVTGSKTGLSKLLLFATVLVERIFDGVALVLLLALGSMALSLPEWATHLRTLALIAFLGALIGVLLLPNLEPFFHRYIKIKKLNTIVEKLTLGVELVRRSPQVLLGCLLLSLAVWAVEGMMFLYGFSLLGIHLSYSHALFTLGVVNLSVLLPSSPGGIGVFQYFCALSLATFDISSSLAGTFGIVIHLCQLLPVIFIGAGFAAHFGISLQEVNVESTPSTEISSSELSQPSPLNTNRTT